MRLQLPSWVPEERAISSALVLLLALAIAILAAARGPSSLGSRLGANVSEPAPTLSAPAAPGIAAFAATEPPAATASPAIPAENLGAAATAASAPSQAPTYVPAPALETPAAAQAEGTDGGLLPGHRIVTYYGHPHDEHMGILGEHSKEELLAMLQAEAGNYEAADPSRPVIPAFELIATVAQGDPGADGTYILNTDVETLADYADFAAQNNALVILDLQIGRGTVAAEIDKVRSLLERPNVHLALDPEFAIAPGETPGLHIGSLDADSITYAQETLAAIARDHNLPPKILIVHQFREDMIQNKDRLKPVPGVQLVIDADGFGAPELKTTVYNIIVRDQPVQFAGIKLFYKQDRPLLNAQEVLALKPAPDVVIYQ